MADPLFTALVPVRLVMRKQECMYCFAEDTNAALIDAQFGLKVCDTHMPNGKRDCKAYLHTNKMVRVRDAESHPVVGRFLSLLKEQGTFKVERSDLTIDPGWTIQKDSSYWEPSFITGSDGIWRLPVLYDNSPKRIFKHTPIIHFLRPDILEQMPGLHTMIEDTIDALNEGIYKAEYEEFQKAFEQDRVGTVAEIEGVSNIFYEGESVRIYLPHGRPAPEQPSDPA